MPGGHQVGQEVVEGEAVEVWCSPCKLPFSSADFTAHLNRSKSCSHPADLFCGIAVYG